MTTVSAFSGFHVHLRALGSVLVCFDLGVMEPGVIKQQTSCAFQCVSKVRDQIHSAIVLTDFIPSQRHENKPPVFTMIWTI